MLYRLFSHLVIVLFLIVHQGLSHSMENPKQLYIPEFSSVREAVKYWGHHCQNLTIDREEVREKISKLTCDYDYLKKEGFDVLNPNDDIGDVFTNISLNCYQREENELTWFLEVLANSLVTQLTLQDIAITPNIGEAVVKLLNGDKKFQKLDFNGRRNPKLITHDLRWEGFDSSTDEKYQMIKKIGLAAAGKVDEFVFSKYSVTEQCPFDFDAYDPQEDYENALEEQKSREVKEEPTEGAHHKLLWISGIAVVASIVYPSLSLSYLLFAFWAILYW